MCRTSRLHFQVGGLLVPAESLGWILRHAIAGQGANIDTTTAGGRLVLFAANDCGAFIGEGARAQWRPSLHDDAGQLHLAQAAMATRDTKVGDLCKELGVMRQTLYGPVTAKLCEMAKCEISCGDVRRSVRATSM